MTATPEDLRWEQVMWQGGPIRQWALLDENGQAVRHVVERQRWFNEPGNGPRYQISGGGYESARDSLDEAKAAAEASLRR